MRPGESVAMQPAELKQHMSRDDKLRLPVTSRGVSGERVVARHVRVNDFDPVSCDEPREFMRARYIEGVAQRQRLDLVAIELEMTDQRRVWTHHGVEIVTTRDERICEIRNVTLTTAERCR